MIRTMANELTLSLLLLLIATACAFECYDYATVSCGEHDVQYDAVCDVWEALTFGDETKKKTCNGEWNKCASGEMTYSHSIADFQLKIKFASCATGESACLEDVEEIDQKLGSDVASLLNALQPSVTSNSNEFCVCEGDLCNSALPNVCHFSVLLFGVLVALFM